MTMNPDAAKNAVVRVGEGRGFVVNGPRRALVITAAHCLPFFPPCASSSYPEQRTYTALLAPLGKEPAVWAECLFVDPIGDIAVLGPPDKESVGAEVEAYEALIDAVVPLPIIDSPKAGPAWLLSLSGSWFRCAVRHNGGPLWITDAAEGIVGGMSGSPILADDGSTIGIVCTAGGFSEKKHTEGGPNPSLMNNLPGWFFLEPHRPPGVFLQPDVAHAPDGTVSIGAKPRP